MLIKNLKIALLTCLIALACSATSFAQQEITPEKRALIKELLEVTDAAKMADNMMNVIMSQSDKIAAEVSARTLAKKKDLTPAMREDLQRETSEKAIASRQRFREAFIRRVNLPQFLIEVSYPVYDKYYTEGELKDLIAFYKTPTGKKSIETAPQLLAEFMEQTNRVLLPKLEPIMTELLEEEKKEMEKEMEELDKVTAELDKAAAPPSKTKPRRTKRRTSKH